MEQADSAKKVWEEPRLLVHGDVVRITQNCDKQFGESDGFTFIGQAIICRATS